MGERMATLGRAGPMMFVVLSTIGGIYLGIFTPAEAAAVGAFMALIYSWWNGSLSLKVLEGVLLDTIKTTAMVFLILIGALVFGPFLALSQLPMRVADMLSGLDLNAYVILAIIMMIFVMLGMFLEGFSMLVLTLPIVIPIVKALGFDLIWFGVLMVIVLELGSDKSTGRNQRLRREGAGAGRAAQQGVPRHCSLRARDGGRYRPSHDLPRNRALPAELDDQIGRAARGGAFFPRIPRRPCYRAAPGGEPFGAQRRWGFFRLGRGRGGTGRRSGFRFHRREAWGFESLRPHQAPKFAASQKLSQRAGPARDGRRI